MRPTASARHIAAGGQVGKHGANGYTVWGWTNGRLNAALCPDIKEAIDTALSQ